MASASASSTPSVDAHDHKGPTCPVTGGHGFCPAQKGDSRSPCPALNTMANHGFISRSGRKLGAWEITQGLKACYGLTTPFAIFLTYTTFIMLRKSPFSSIDLYDIGKHGVVEHDASLVHHDTPAGETYAPIEIDQALVEEVVKDAQTIVEEEIEVEVEVEKDGVKTKETKKEKREIRLLSTDDVGRARVRREKLSPPLGAKHAEIARGEVAIILGVWEKKVGDKRGAPIDWIKKWLSEERLPDGWVAKPASFGLGGTRERAKAIKAAAEAIRAQEAKDQEDKKAMAKETPQAAVASEAKP